MPGSGNEALVRLLGNPLKMSVTPVQYRSRPPHLDADREAVMRLLEPDAD